MEEISDKKFEELGIAEKYIMEKYKQRKISLSDIMKYDLLGKISGDRIDEENEQREVLQKIGLEKLKHLDKDLWSVAYFSKKMFSELKSNLEILEKLDPESCQEKMDELQRNAIIKCINEFGFSDAYYQKIQDNSTARRLAGEYIIDFNDDQTAIEWNFLNIGLKFNHIFENIDIFKNKKFCPKIRDLNPKITEEKIIYFFENFPQITKLCIDAHLPIKENELDKFILCIDETKSLEENQKRVQEYVQLKKQEIKQKYETEGFYQNVSTQRAAELYGSMLPFSEFMDMFNAKQTKDIYDELKIILESSSVEKLKGYNLPTTIFLDYQIRKFFMYYGIDNIMQFEQENGNWLSKNGYEYLKFLSQNGTTNPLVNYKVKEIPNLTKEDLENRILDVLVNGVEINDDYGQLYIENRLDHNGFSEQFQDRILDGNLKKISDLIKQDEKIKEEYFKRLKNVLKKYSLKYISVLYQGNILHKMFDSSFNMNVDEDTVEEWFIENFKEQLKEGRIEHKNDEDRRIKELLPEFYIDESAPIELKKKFYSFKDDSEYDDYEPGDAYYEEQELQIEDLGNIEYLKYLYGKDLSASKKAEDLNLLLLNFSKEEILYFIFKTTDINSVDNVDKKIIENRIKLLNEHCRSAEKIKTFKENLSKYPEYYAKKEFCKQKNLAFSEFEEQELNENDKQFLECLTDKYKELIFANPEFSIVPEEKKEDIDFSEFEKIEEMTDGMYSISDRKRILWQMYGFLEYRNCKNLFESMGKDAFKKVMEKVFFAGRVYTNNFSKTFMKNKKEIFDNPEYITTLCLALHSSRSVNEAKQNIEQFLENSEFKSFHSNFKTLKCMQELEKASPEEKRDFYKFAKIFGCFSTQKLLDKDGKETSVTMAQKASSVFAKIMENTSLRIGDFHKYFDSLSPNADIISQEFLNFISVSSRKGYYDNLELLLDLEQENRGIFEKVMTDFEDAQKCRKAERKDGLPMLLTWREALTAFYRTKKFNGVTKENADIAKVFSQYPGISQSVFDEASKLRQEAIADNVPEHILGKCLEEESLLQSIERIRESTKEELRKSEDLLESLYEKQFTFEWLSKRAPENGILGSIYCDCCANLKSGFYGKKIAVSSITAKDVQNLVVRDNNGEIIAKCTMYANENLGYCVINDFEISDKYKKTEDRGSDSYGGRYTGEFKKEEEKTPTEKEEDKNRQLIYQAFSRGILKFVEEYDKVHPDNPIKQINVGMGYNKLKKQTTALTKATELLTVPMEYSFEDAEEEQYIFYKRTEDTKTKEDSLEGFYEDKIDMAQDDSER